MGKLEQEIREALSNPSPRLHQQDEDRLVANISALLTRKLAEAAPPAGDLEEIRGRVREAVYVCVPSGTHDSILPVVEGVIERILPIVEQLAGERDGQEARAESAEQYAATLESDNGRILAEKGRAVQERDAARARAYSAIEALSVADDVTALEACCAAIGILNGTDPIAATPQPPASDGGEVDEYDPVESLALTLLGDASCPECRKDLLVRWISDHNEARARRQGGGVMGRRKVPPSVRVVETCATCRFALSESDEFEKMEEEQS